MEFVHPRLYVTATHFPGGALRVFGDDPSESLFDALMASTALPPLFPPWEVNGELYVDGGIVSDLPLLVAAERGADEIYALQITNPPEDASTDLPHGALAIGSQVLSLILDHHAEAEMRALQERTGIRLHPQPDPVQADPGFWDFTHAEELIAHGRHLTEACLRTLSAAESESMHQSSVLQLVGREMQDAWDTACTRVQQMTEAI